MNLLSWPGGTPSSGNAHASGSRSTAKKGVYIPDRLGRLGQGTWMPQDTLPDPFGRLPGAERGVVPPGMDDWLKDRFTLSGPVGASGANRLDDVAKVEMGLGATGHLNLDATGGPTGYHGVRLNNAIRDFQADAGLKVDGKINPGGETIRILGQAMGSPLSGPKPSREELMELMDAGDNSGGPSSELDDAVAETVLSLVPVVGEVMSGKDALESGSAALEAIEKGDWDEAKKQGGLTALNAAGAVPIGGAVLRGVRGGFKVGKAATKAARASKVAEGSHVKPPGAASEAASEAASGAEARAIPELSKFSRTENPVTLEEFTRMPETGAFDPRRIRAAQGSAGSTFKDGRSVAEMAEDLRAGRLNPADVEPIRIVEKDGSIWTLDHRRLVAFRTAGVKIPYQKVRLKDLDKNDLRKFDSKDNGMSMRIRGVD